jgi:hypothetical protein
VTLPEIDPGTPLPEVVREAQPGSAPPKRTRANYVAAPHYFLLSQACAVINQAFQSGFGCYLVGSSITRKDYRDVDVRMIIDDVEFEKLFPGAKDGPQYNGLWSLMCASISLYLSQASGLPIDFQIQAQSVANSIPDRTERQALGIFLGYPGGK